MAREIRGDIKAFQAATVAATGACLFYGAVLTARGGNASLKIYDHGRLTGATNALPKIRLYMGSVTGTVSVIPPVAIQMDNGLFATLSAKAIGTVFFSARK